MPPQEPEGADAQPAQALPSEATLQTSNLSDTSGNTDELANEKQLLPPTSSISNRISWLQVLACVLVQFVTGGWAGCAGLFQIHYTKTLMSSAHNVAWITGLETFFTFVPSAIVGRLCDLGYIKSSMLTGNILLSAGGLAISWSTQNLGGLIAVQGVVMGIARCLVWIPSTFIICTYFEDKKLPIALAIIHAGSATGSLIFPVILEFAQKQMGFPIALRIMASLSFGLLIVSFCIFRPKPRVEHPTKTSLLHAGAFKKIPYCIVVVTSLVMCAGSAAGATFANSFAKQKFHLTEAQTLPINLIRQAASIPSAALAAWIAYKHCNCLKISIVIAFGSALCYFGWLGVSTLAIMYTWVLFKGLLHGGLGCMITAVITRVVRSEKLFGDHQHLWGARLGMIATFEGIGGLGGPMVFAKMYSATGGNYLPGQIFCGTCYVVAGISLVLLSMASSEKDTVGERDVEAEAIREMI